MNNQQITIWLQNNAKFFPEGHMEYLNEKLSPLSDDQFLQCTTLEFQNPTMIFIISIFFGELGIDRFMVGDTGIGVLKLLTGGCCGILWLIDIFTIGQKAKENNLKKINSVLLIYNSADDVKNTDNIKNASILDSADLLLNYKELVNEKIITKEQFDTYKEKILKGKITQPIEIASVKKYKTLYDEKLITEEEYNKYISDAIEKVNIIKLKKKITNILTLEIFYVNGEYSREKVKVCSANPSISELQNVLKENGNTREILKYNILDNRSI